MAAFATLDGWRSTHPWRLIIKNSPPEPNRSCELASWLRSFGQSYIFWAQCAKERWQCGTYRLPVETIYLPRRALQYLETNNLWARHGNESHSRLPANGKMFIFCPLNEDKSHWMLMIFLFLDRLYFLNLHTDVFQRNSVTPRFMAVRTHSKLSDVISCIIFLQLGLKTHRFGGKCCQYFLIFFKSNLNHYVNRKISTESIFRARIIKRN